MTPFARRNLFRTLSVIFFAGLIFVLKTYVPSLGSRVQHLEIIFISAMIMMSLVCLLFWTLFGVIGGLVAFLISMIFLYGPITALNPYYYIVIILPFFLASFIGYHINKKITTSDKEYTVTMEKVQEDINLIRNHLKTRELEVTALGGKIGSLLKLKKIADRISLSLSGEDTIKIVVDETFAIFGKEKRVLLFFKEANKGLTLSYTSKGEDRKAFMIKNGGIFDKWVLNNMKSLLVKDLYKDFRFSIGEEGEKDDATSLISKPLLVEGNILGVLRVDSSKESAFGQLEMRILDIIGELAAVALENARLYEQTKELAIRDSLTHLYVHRYFMDRLEEEVKRAHRSDASFALIMMDIDDFKDFNDKLGHIAGDALLKKIGTILESKTSPGDIVARYGGEEFAFLTLNRTRKEAITLANEIRKEIQNSPITMRRKKYSVTISAGVAIFPDDAKLKEDIIWEADKWLYKAKEKGKNAVCSSK